MMNNDDYDADGSPYHYNDIIMMTMMRMNDKNVENETSDDEMFDWEKKKNKQKKKKKADQVKKNK